MVYVVYKLPNNSIIMVSKVRMWEDVIKIHQPIECEKIVVKNTKKKKKTHHQQHNSHILNNEHHEPQQKLGDILVISDAQRVIFI